jgi:putative cardiolipin synthase
MLSLILSIAARYLLIVIHSPLLSKQISITLEKSLLFNIIAPNLDPRAIKISTENGLYIESTGFCGPLADEFEIRMAPADVWRVALNKDNTLRWETSAGSVSVQPARSFLQRIADFFSACCPTRASYRRERSSRHVNFSEPRRITC